MIAAKRTGTIDTLECDVPLSKETDSAFRACWNQLLIARPPRIVLDMKGIPLVDSAGLESLEGALRRGRWNGGSRSPQPALP